MTETIELTVRVPKETVDLLNAEYPGKSLKDYENWVLKYLNGMVHTGKGERITVKCPRCSNPLKARPKGYTKCPRCRLTLNPYQLGKEYLIK